MRFGLRFQIKTVARQKKRFCRKQTGRSTHQADHSRSIGWPTRKIRLCPAPAQDRCGIGEPQRSKFSLHRESRASEFKHLRNKVNAGTWLKPGAWGCKTK